MTHLLGSSGPGDVVAQAILPLVLRAPLNPTVPNLDTDRDNRPGLELKKHGTFDIYAANGEEDYKADELQRFRLDRSGLLTLDGRASAAIWMSANNFRADEVQAAAALMDCPDLPGTCTMLASATVDFVGVRDQFTLHTFDFGTVARKIPAIRNLQLWIIATEDSGHDMYLAYDTVGFESALTLNR